MLEASCELRKRKKDHHGNYRYIECKGCPGGEPVADPVIEQASPQETSSPPRATHVPDGFGKRLREVRGTLSLREFAEKVRMHIFSIQSWEHEESCPQGQQVDQLCRALNINVPWLLRGDGPKYASIPEPPKTSIEKRCDVKRGPELVRQGSPDPSMWFVFLLTDLFRSMSDQQCGLVLHHIETTMAEKDDLLKEKIRRAKRALGVA